MKKFRAVVTECIDDRFVTSVKERNVEDLPSGDLLIRVQYSSVNYKDGLSSMGNRGVTKSYPHTPGVDAAGVVEISSSPYFKAGDAVIVTGYDLGMNTSGGFAEYIRVPEGWAVKMPEGFDAETAMFYGTAGFTAALSVMKIMEKTPPDKNHKILVTGATGGVGSVAVAMLSKLGYYAAASTGRAEKADFLKTIGADVVVGRQDILDNSSRPLLKGMWDGAVDTVGGDVLASVLKSVKYGSAVTACGLTGSQELNTTVFPFILRGVTLYGIDSVELPIEEKIKVWDSVASLLRVSNYEAMRRIISLDDLPQYLAETAQGRSLGRVTVRI